MIRCSSLRLAFIHAPKTGGSSITAALAPWADNGPERPPRERRGWQIQYHHGSRHMHAVTMPDIEGYTVAVFIRDPWDRARSIWTFNRIQRGKRHETFAEFLQRLIDRPKSLPARYRQHGRHQVSFVEHANWVGRFETLEQDWARLCAHVGLSPVPPLEHRNRARQEIREGVEHTPETNAMVRQVWHDDCAELGYKEPECT